MAVEVLLPRQGNTVETCIILEWRVEEGQAVKQGDILCEVETDKATFEVESTGTGTLLKQVYGEGDEVPVLDLIALIGESGEDISGYLEGKTDESEGTAPADNVESSTSAGTSDTVAPQAESSSGESDTVQNLAFSGTVLTGSGFVAVSPRAKNLAVRENFDYRALQGTGPKGRIIERDVAKALAERGALTNAARDAAAGKTVPAAGSGIGGRIRLDDLAGASAPAAVSPVQETAKSDFPGAQESIPVRSIRKIVAERMSASLSNTAQLTLNSSANAVSMMAYRKKCKASANTDIQGITLNDFALFAVSRTLKEFPEMNAHFLGDKIVQFEHIHLGFAVDTPKGLMVPVIRYADTLSLKQISMEARRLAAACFDGTISPDLLSGGTFTVTNLGSLGIESFTPVLNMPQVGILGLCTITPKPVMRNGETVFLPHMGVSLTFDHQAVDGAPAARFLKRYSEVLADFELSLAE